MSSAHPGVDLKELGDALGEENDTHARKAPEPTPRESSDVATIHSIFPSMDTRTIASVLEKYRGNMEAGAFVYALTLAIPVLLQKSDPDFKPSAADLAQQQDERLAKHLRVRQAEAEPPRAQTWDPSQLSYSPRLPRARRGAQGTAPPNHHANLETPEMYEYRTTTFHADDAPQINWHEEFARLKQTGMAKVGSTFSQLRQKAETAMRTLDEERGLRFKRGGPKPAEQAGGRHSIVNQKNQENWDTVQQTLRHVYDADPQPVHDAELEKMMRGEETSSLGSGDAVKRSKARQTNTPLWGQRYATKPPSSTARNTVPFTGTDLKGWDDVGHIEPENMAPSEKKEPDADTKLPEKKPKAKSDAPSEATSSSATDDPSAPPLEHAPASDTNKAGSEYVNNPFDDDD
ncbi:hypothetical protein MVES1_003518 [Malassezia vespertilionis]|uniref:CUE domain-containing protein n=1 Tax=Malassezia vespertilionis TaxID=2020962 RepID=A0A2N1J702_9BASI|nr:uncharacterized protein MVES1_003518 [Malassezia vespertilionis]PKI82345.1 hypothetical protein MVES_003755 [Malassezia vespertilionis]WFD08148.1 hypothetical protein MVES1_003518 [Malassezia vespertilionis]